MCHSHVHTGTVRSAWLPRCHRYRQPSSVCPVYTVCGRKFKVPLVPCPGRGESRRNPVGAGDIIGETTTTTDVQVERTVKGKDRLRGARRRKRKKKKRNKEGREEGVKERSVLYVWNGRRKFSVYGVQCVQTHVCRSKEWLLLLVADRPRKREEREKGERRIVRASWPCCLLARRDHEEEKRSPSDCALVFW